MKQAGLNNHYKNAFRSLLQEELLKRCKKNPRYSLRSFARSLEIDSATLSQILRGKRTLTEKTTRKLAVSLGLRPDQLEAHVSDKKDLRELSADLFAVMSDWYHDAILELTSLPHFKTDKKWIATTLGITVSEVNIAVERLTSLEFLEITRDGKWHNRLGDNTTIASTDLTSSALRKLQKQILEMSLKALEEIPKPLRDHTSSLMRVELDDLPEIKNKVAEFRRGLLAYAERKVSKPQHLYQLSVSFFPITKIQRSFE